MSTGQHINFVAVTLVHQFITRILLYFVNTAMFTGSLKIKYN